MRILLQDIITAADVELIVFCVTAYDSISLYTIPHKPFLDLKNNNSTLFYAIKHSSFKSVQYLLLELNNMFQCNNQIEPASSPPQPSLHVPPQPNIDLNSTT